jgi:hypothetical protein
MSALSFARRSIPLTDCDGNGSPIGTNALAKAFAYHAGLSAAMLE